MLPATEVRASRLFVILNPSAGSYRAEEVQAALVDRFACGEGSCEVHEATGADDLAALARSAVERGCDLVVAAGGDGTVSAVAGGLVGTEARLGILPLGTGNVLARELGLPLDLPSAVKLLASPAAIRTIDAMRTDGRHFFTQIGVGLDALMIRDTPRESKKRFGRLAYLWTGLTRLLGHQPRRFAVHVGERRTSHRASEVLVANSGTLGQPPFRWGPDIRLDDARVNILIVRAKTLLDYGRLSWNFFRGRHRDDPNVRYLVAGDTIRIESDEPLPVQADGEIIGETPVTVEVVPAAVRVIVPSGKPAEKAPEG